MAADITQLQATLNTVNSQLQASDDQIVANNSNNTVANNRILEAKLVLSKQKDDLETKIAALTPP